MHREQVEGASSHDIVKPQGDAHLLRLGKVESKHIEALVVQQLQLCGELLLLEAYHVPVCLHHQDQAPLTDDVLRRLQMGTAALRQ